MSDRLTTEEFVTKARKAHGDKYLYDKSIYNGYRNKLVITCPLHGDFEQTPMRHLMGRGCQLCGNNKRAENNRKTTEYFIGKAKEIHGDKYDYSLVNYHRWNEKIQIICRVHGVFNQTPNRHLSGNGCPTCRNELLSSRKRRTCEEFIENAKNVHGEKYDYSKTKYTLSTKKVIITCPKHGDFLQQANSHLRGVGCPKCSESKTEKEIYDFLTANSIQFEYQKRFDWLGKQSLDFYLPKYNIGIECQGIQHFSDKLFHGKHMYNLISNRDIIKKRLCDENNIDLVYYTTETNCPDDYIGTIFKDKDELIRYITNIPTVKQ